MRFEEYEEIITHIEHIIETFNQIVMDNGTAIFKNNNVFLQMNEVLIKTILQFFNEIQFMNCSAQAFELQHQHILTYSHLTKSWEMEQENSSITPINQVIQDKLHDLIPFILKQKPFHLYKIQLSDIPNSYRHVLLWCQCINTSTFRCFVTDLRYTSEQPLQPKRLLFHLSKEELLNHKEVVQKYSLYQINQAFKFYFNCTSFTYYQQIQMIKVFELSLLTNYSMKQIAKLAGYNSYTTMNRTFKRYNYPLKNLPRLIA